MKNPMLITKTKSLFAKNTYTIKDAENRILNVMYYEDPSSENYRVMAENLERIRKAEGVNQHPILTEFGKGVLAGATSLAGIKAIVHAEDTMILSSKAMQFVPKLKIF